MRVWFTVEDRTFDYGNDGPLVKLFSTHEAAKTYLDNLIKWAEMDCDDSWEKETETEYGYEEHIYYELGYYARNHIRIELNSQEV